MIQDRLISDEDEDFVTPAENFVRKNLTKYIKAKDAANRNEDIDIKLRMGIKEQRAWFRKVYIYY